MMEGSEPVKSDTQRPTRSSLYVVEESNKVENFQNAASSCWVLIIRRSLVRVQPPPPNFSRTYWQLSRRLEDQFSTTLRTSPSHRLRPWWESECNSYALSGTRLVAKNPLHDQLQRFPESAGRKLRRLREYLGGPTPLPSPALISLSRSFAH